MLNLVIKEKYLANFFLLSIIVILGSYWFSPNIETYPNFLRNLNYFYILLNTIFFFVLFKKSNLSKKLGLTFLVFIIFMLIHAWVVASYPGFKNILNQSAFAVGTAMLASLINGSKKNISNTFPIYLLFFFSASSVLIVGSGIYNYDAIFQSLNHWYLAISEQIFITKENLGELLAWLAVYIIVYQRKVTNKILFGIFVALASLGIRTFWFGFIFLYIFWMLAHYKWFVQISSAILFTFAFYLIVAPIHLPMLLLQDIRGIQYQVVLDVSHEYVLGIGFGDFVNFLTEVWGYSPYDFIQRVNHDQRFIYQKDSINVLESSILIILISYGVIVTSAFMVLCLSAIRTIRINYTQYDPMGKFAGLLFSWYFFAGFTQDYIFKLPWWIMIGISFFYLFNISHVTGNPVKNA